MPDKTIKSKLGDNIDKIVKRNKITADIFLELNGSRDLKWNLDGRFDYINNQDFKLLNDGKKKRINKLFLDNSRLEYQFYNVDVKGNVVKKIKRKQTGIDALNFLKNLSTT